MATVVVGTKIFFFGGLTTTDWINGVGSNLAFSYDTATNEWNQLTNISVPRYGMAAATDGQDKIWVFGRSLFLALSIIVLACGRNMLN